MEKIVYALKALMKIMLILAGGLMLIGGGLCVVSNAFFAIPNLFRQEVMLYLMLMGVSALIAVIGWWLLKLSGVMKSSKSGQETASITTEDSDAN